MARPALSLKYSFLIIKILLFVPACKTIEPSTTMANIQANFKYPGYWKTRDIKVCITDLATISPARLEKAKLQVTEEFKKVGFSFSRGWTKCVPADEGEALVKVTFALGMPPPFGGSSPVGVDSRSHSEVRLRADFETHSTEYCRNNPDTCLLAATVHEFGHVVGLRHSHEHPLATIPGTETPVYPMPVHINNMNPELTWTNFLGPYDPVSIMNYLHINGPTGRSQITLSESDKASIQAIYDQPTVVLGGASLRSAGHFVSRIDLLVEPLNLPKNATYPTTKATHYQFKIVKEDEDCSVNRSYSALRPINIPISRLRPCV